MWITLFSSVWWFLNFNLEGKDLLETLDKDIMLWFSRMGHCGVGEGYIRETRMGIGKRRGQWSDRFIFKIGSRMLGSCYIGVTCCCCGVDMGLLWCCYGVARPRVLPHNIEVFPDDQCFNSTHVKSLHGIVSSKTVLASVLGDLIEISAWGGKDIVWDDWGRY